MGGIGVDTKKWARCWCLNLLWHYISAQLITFFIGLLDTGVHVNLRYRISPKTLLYPVRLFEELLVYP